MTASTPAGRCGFDVTIVMPNGNIYLEFISDIELYTAPNTAVSKLLRRLAVSIEKPVVTETSEKAATAGCQHERGATQVFGKWICKHCGKDMV